MRLPLSSSAGSAGKALDAHCLPDHRLSEQTVESTDAETRGAPVIVLTYPYGGAGRLNTLLARYPDVACTSGTGILPLCEQAAAAWRGADGRDAGPLPRLAAVSIRALAGTIITTLLAREGRRRWCEIATAQPSTAETFLRLYPATRVICLHRACPDVGYAALHDNPWGLAHAGFAPFTAAYPGSTAAALVAYWAAHTAPLIAFEEAHPGQCRRLRYEDLASGMPLGLPSFLGLPDSPGPGQESPASTTANYVNGQEPADGQVPAMPSELIPPALLMQVNERATQLGYPPIT
jgi:hypothetical protein